MWTDCHTESGMNGQKELNRLRLLEMMEQCDWACQELDSESHGR